MRRATLIANPEAGAGRELPQLLAAMTDMLKRAGIEADSAIVTAPGTAGRLAAEAIASGSDVVFACGGDGTVHDVLQGTVGKHACLGIIPLGTANALARNLGLSTDPLRALAQQIHAGSERIAVGEATVSTSLGSGRNQPIEPLRRYFMVLAGAGPDGALVYSLLAGQKSAMGRTAYYVHAARLYATRSFRPFRIRFRQAASDRWEEDRAVSAISARIGDLGGVFGRLTKGSSLRSKLLRLSYLRPPAKISLPSWFVSGQLGIHRLNPWLRIVEVDEFECLPLDGEIGAHAQVDGEWVGNIPIAVRLVPDALSLLVPEIAKARAF